jgi:hypothetical protein
MARRDSGILRLSRADPITVKDQLRGLPHRPPPTHDRPRANESRGATRRVPSVSQSEDGAFWSPAVATAGNQWQIDQEQKRLKQAKSVATRCHRLPEKFHSKGRVDSTSLLLKRGSPSWFRKRGPGAQPNVRRTRHDPTTSMRSPLVPRRLRTRLCPARQSDSSSQREWRRPAIGPRGDVRVSIRHSSYLRSDPHSARSDLSSWDRGHAQGS